MSEVSKYEAQKKKMDGLCEEHDLNYRFRKESYPITLSVSPIQGVGVQMSMLDETDGGDYISPGASLTLIFADGELTSKVSGGTFTISNVGMMPIDWSTPIINPPQVAILGFGRPVKKMAVVNDEPAIRSMMTMYLTFDHRVFDGLETGRIMGDMKTLIENPELITL